MSSFNMGGDLLATSLQIYSYTFGFTNYNSSDSGSDAVTPVQTEGPNCLDSRANVPISNTPPLSESALGAVDWNLWKHIEFMIK